MFLNGTYPSARADTRVSFTDYLAAHPSTSIDPATGRTSVAVPALWEALLYGLAPIWPASRTQLDGVGLGDVWPCDSLAKAKGVEKGDPRALVPFHKLSQVSVCARVFWRSRRAIIDASNSPSGASNSPLSGWPTRSRSPSNRPLVGPL